MAYFFNNYVAKIEKVCNKSELPEIFLKHLKNFKLLHNFFVSELRGLLSRGTLLYLCMIINQIYFDEENYSIFIMSFFITFVSL
jgi:hypothetical protein